MNRLEPYRRHVEGCEHAAKGIGYTRCDCPVWAYGVLHGRRFRRSLQTRSWSRAEERIRLLESGAVKIVRADTRLSQAIDRYLADCRMRNLQPGTLISYRNLLHSLLAAVGDVPIADVSVQAVADFRAGRVVTVATARKELDILRGFFRFCVTNGLRAESPLLAVRPPKGQTSVTLPFNEDEVQRLIEATNLLNSPNGDSCERGRLRAKALILLLLHTGLRIGDAVQLRRDAVVNGRLILRTMKTGVVLSIPLPDAVVAVLEAMPNDNPVYYFWSGRGNPLNLAITFRKILKRLGHLGKVSNPHPHRFRDTFACRLLERGADIRHVSLVLGHSSVTVTERHYAPFVSSHQALLDRTIALLHAKPG